MRADQVSMRVALWFVVLLFPGQVALAAVLYAPSQGQQFSTTASIIAGGVGDPNIPYTLFLKRDTGSGLVTEDSAIDTADANGYFDVTFEPNPTWDVGDYVVELHQGVTMEDSRNIEVIQ